MTLSARSKTILDELADMYKTLPDGSRGVDTAEVQKMVRRDPDAVANVLRVVLANGGGSAIGWGLCAVVAATFNVEHEDDSLNVLVKKAADAEGATIPSIRRVIPHAGADGDPPTPLNALQIPEGDVASGDAYRLAHLFRLKNLNADLRKRMFGNCLLSFPAHGDPRPVQHIERIRAYIGDLHRRVPYFPIFLTLDPAARMWMMYFGCLADPQATCVLPGDRVSFQGDHPTVLAALLESLAGVRHACTELGIDAQPYLRGLVAPFPKDMGQALIKQSAHGTA